MIEKKPTVCSDHTNYANQMCAYSCGVCDTDSSKLVLLTYNVDSRNAIFHISNVVKYLYVKKSFSIHISANKKKSETS